MDSAEYRKAARKAAVDKHNAKRAARPKEAIVAVGTKVCLGCGEEKPAEAFSKHSASRDGLRPRCKRCIAVEHAEKNAPKERKRRMSPKQMLRLGMEIPQPPVEETPDGQIMRVPVNPGRFAVIDAEDWPLVREFLWQVSGWGYAWANTDKPGVHVYMHRLIHPDKETPEVDHRNLDRLDNRKKNLRSCTESQNRANRPKPNGTPGRPPASGFKGVHFHKQSGRWKAAICFRRKAYHLGLFDTPEDAAAAYDDACVKLHEEFARPNRSG